MRSIAIALGGATLALGPATAGASSGETRVTASGDPDTGLTISVTAAPGTANAISIKAEDLLSEAEDQLVLRDTAGMTEDSPYCAQASPTVIRCDATGLERLAVNSGDRADRVVITSAPDNSVKYNVVVRAGSGNDRVGLAGPGTASGQAGSDILIGGAGNQRLYGGPGRDRISAGRGSDDYCNGGADQDAGGNGCEESDSIP